MRSWHPTCTEGRWHMVRPRLIGLVVWMCMFLWIWLSLLQRNLNPNLDPLVESMSPCEACWPPISLPQIWVEWSDYDDTWISKLVKQMMFHFVYTGRVWWMAWCMKPLLRIATFCGGANMASAFVGKLVCRRKPIRWKLWRGRESASSSRRVPREAGCM